MTVKEACSVLTDSQKLFISWDGCIHQIDPHDEIMMDAFGNYLVKSIAGGHEEFTYEITVAVKPIRIGGEKQ